jgi:hypothetical protein
MFGRKQAKIDGLKMAFYTDAAEHGWHGKILVTSRRRGLERVVVNFVFVGMTEPPALTPELMRHIWTEAKAQGFVPFEIVGALEVNKAPEKHSGATALLDPSTHLPDGRSVAAVLTSKHLGPETLGTPRRTIVKPPANTPVDLSSDNLSTLSGSVTMYDPQQATTAEIPAFLRKHAGEALAG